MQENEHEMSGQSRNEKHRLGHKRVHWRVLVLLDHEHKLPGHIVEVSDGAMRMASLYSFRVGASLNLALFLPDATNPGKYVTAQFGGRVSYQVMHGDEVQTGLECQEMTDATISAIQAAMKTDD